MNPSPSARALALAGLVVLCSGSAAAQVQKLNGPLAFGLLGDVEDAQVSQDGTRVVYLADQDRDQHLELYGVPSDRSTAPVKLNDRLAGGVQAFAIAPDGSRVVYTADRADGGVIELFSVPSDGSANPLRLNQPLVAGGSVSYSPGPTFVITPDGARVLFIADALVDERYELFSVPIDRGSDPLRLSGDLVAGGDVPGWLVFNHALLVSPDGRRAVYLADAEDDERYELFSVPTDGSAGPVELSRIVNTAGDVEQLALTPDGTRVLYVADQQTDGRGELFSVPSDGSANPRRLNPSLGSGFVTGYELGADGSQVVFRVTRTGATDLYRAPTDGSSPAVLLNGVSGSGALVTEFALSPDDSRVVYAASRSTSSGRADLYSVPSDASAAPIRINGPLSGDDFLNAFVHFTPDSARVVYTADQLTNGVQELFSVPADGSQLPLRLNPPLPPDVDVFYNGVALTSSGARVLFKTQTDLYVVPVDGSAAALRLDAPGQDVLVFIYAAGTERVLYRFLTGVQVTEIGSVPADGSAAPLVLNAPLTGGPAGDVLSFATSADGRWTVYRANQDDVGAIELFSVPSDGSAEPLRLHGALGGNVQTHALAPDGATVVYVADHDTPGTPSLYSVPTDGHLAPLKLSDALRVSSASVPPRVSPDGAAVVFQTFDFALYSVPLHGGGPPSKLSLPVDQVLEFQISPDSSHVVYRNGQLYGVPLAGGQAPQLLSSESTSTAVLDYALSPDSVWAVYRRQQSNGRYELFSVPLDGSLAPGSFDARGVAPDFAILPDATAVVFRADRDTPGTIELYRGPLAGRQPPTKLNGPLVTGGDVLSFGVSPDGARVVYRAAQDHVGVTELFSVPADGSLAPVQLNGALVSFGDVVELTFSPDSSRVVYRADEEVNEVDELHAARVDGTGAVVRLDPQRSFADVAGGSKVAPRGRLVLYRVDAEQDERFELFAATLDGGAALKLNPELDSGGDVQADFVVVGERVLYRADQDLDDVFELYERPLGRGIRAASAPR